MNGGLAAALDIHPRRRYTAHKRQSDKSAAAHIEFCSVLASLGVYTEFGIEPFDAAIHATFPQTEIQNCILHQLRKVTRAKSVFPTDDSLLKMLYLAMMDITKKWTGRRQDWSVIHAQLSIYFAGRMPE